MSSSIGLLRTILLFLAALLVLLPLRWEWRTSKVAAFALIAWLFVTNVVNGVGAIVWMKASGPGLDGNMNAVASVYCDIATKIIVGSWTAVPAASFCIAHRLLVASSRARSFRTIEDNNHSKRGNFIDAVVCFVVPAAFMALHYIVQDHRFDLIEVVGCQPAVLYSTPAVFIIWAPVLLFSFVSLVLAVFATHFFLSTRPRRPISPPSNFRHISHPYPLSTPIATRSLKRPSVVPQPSPPQPPYPPCLFIRLLTLVVVLAIVTVGLTIANMVYVIANGKMRAYPSFDTVHREISRVGVFFLSKTDTNGIERPNDTLIDFAQLVFWTAPAPTSAYVFIIMVSHWCECVRFVARIGGMGRWLGWKVARARGWLKGEKVWEEESLHGVSMTHSRSTSASLSQTTTTRTSVSTLPPYTVNGTVTVDSFTAHPFPARPTRKPPPPPLLLTNSNRLIPHALRPSSLYGGPAQIDAPGVDEMGSLTTRQSQSSNRNSSRRTSTSTSRTTRATEQHPTVASAHPQRIDGDGTYVYRPSIAALYPSERDSMESWADFPLASPGTLQREYVLPALPSAVQEHIRARSEMRGNVSTSMPRKAQKLSRRSAVYERVPISVGSQSVELERDGVVGGTQAMRIPGHMAAAVGFPTPSITAATNLAQGNRFDDTAMSHPSNGKGSHQTSRGRSRPVSNASTLHRTPTRGSSHEGVPKYHMPSRMLSPTGDCDGSVGSASDAGSERSGPGIAGVGSGKWA